MPGKREQRVSLRKNYASQESIAATLTRAELAAPFRPAEPDRAPLPRVTRHAVLADDGGVIATGAREILAALGDAP